MKIIFLDIDGVLNDHKTSASHYCTISAVAVEQFNRLLAAVPDAQIVVSSAWRYLVHSGQMTVKGFESMLLTHGVACYDRVIGVTESDEVTAQREGVSKDDDYFEWLIVHGCRLRAMQIDQYALLNWFDELVVLDDLDIPIPNLVRTDGTVGLTAADTDRAIAILTA